MFLNNVGNKILRDKIVPNILRLIWKKTENWIETCFKTPLSQIRDFIQFGLGIAKCITLLLLIVD